jgi:hypothetical protein
MGQLLPGRGSGSTAYVAFSLSSLLQHGSKVPDAARLQQDLLGQIDIVLDGADMRGLVALRHVFSPPNHRVLSVCVRGRGEVDKLLSLPAGSEVCR